MLKKQKTNKQEKQILDQGWKVSKISHLTLIKETTKIVRKDFWMVKNDIELFEKLRVHAESFQVKVISLVPKSFHFQWFLSLPYKKPLGDFLFKKWEND